MYAIYADYGEGHNFSRVLTCPRGKELRKGVWKHVYQKTIPSGFSMAALERIDLFPVSDLPVGVKAGQVVKEEAQK